MTNYQENLLTAYTTSINFLKEHESVTNQIPVFATAISNAEQKIAEIRDLDQQREVIKEGITKEKRKERDDLEKIIFKISSAVTLYGNLNSRQDLTDAFDMEYSDLEKSRDQQLIKISEALHTAVSSLITELADYGITEEMVNKLEQEKNEFENAIAKQGAKDAGYITLTGGIKKKFKELRLIFENNLDKLVDYFRDQDRDFYEGYYSARRIIDRGIRHEKETGETNQV